MCIRDRFVIEGSDGSGRSAQINMLTNWLEHEGYAVVNVGPVSYTHLRAHETVLDLVCRLLLEKKKHTTLLEDY